MTVVDTSFVFLDNFLHYILAARKILGAIEDGLETVIHIAKFKTFVQVTSFQTLKFQEEGSKSNLCETFTTTFPGHAIPKRMSRKHSWESFTYFSCSLLPV